MFDPDQNPTENHNRDDETPPVSGSADDAPQTAGEDPAVTPDQPGRRKKRTRAEMEAARAAGEVPPKRDRRASVVGDPVEEPAPAAPAADTHVNITLNPIDGKLTAEAINKAANLHPESDGGVLRGRRNRAVFVDEAAFIPGKVVAADDFSDEVHSPEVHHDYKSIAKARLKVYGKYAARARAAAKLWPNDPARYFDTVGKIFVDLAADEDRGVIDALVLDLLPKPTIAAIERSGITVI